jgi:hypothetical protein
MGQFEKFGNDPILCAVCEAMCPEAVDGTLTAAEQQAFDKHVAGCVACAQEFEEAHRGAAWMAMLKGHTPEPPDALLQKILAQTTGVASPVFQHQPAPIWDAPTLAPTPFPIAARPSRWATFSAKLSDMFSMQGGMSFQPRLAMTAAMAFFSIALTLNMMGVRVRDLHAGMLRPTSLRRSVADASASATRSFQNLRVVYEFESKVSDLRNNGNFGTTDDQRDPAGPFAPKGEKDPTPTTPAPDQNKPSQPVPQGKSELDFPIQQQGAAARKGA